jgi:preprotein translocase subunit Sss1
MEILEPKKKRSPIESLKFQRKSDYKKFRNFIKKETKELKGIVQPKEDKLKNILKVSAVGLGIAGLAGLISRGLRGKGDKDGNNVFPFAIGRKNYPDPSLPTPPVTTPKPKTPKPKFKRPISKTAELPKRKFTISQRGRSEAARLRQKQLVTSTGVVEGDDQVKVKRDSGNRKISKRRTIIEPKPGEVEKSKKLINRKKLSQKAFGKFLRDKNFRSDINKAANMATINQFEKEGFRNIKKKLRNIDKNENAPTPFNRVKTKGRNANTGMGADFSSTGETIGKKKRYRGRIKNRDVVLRSGVRGFSKPDPFNRFGTVETPIMSQNPFKKGFMGNIFKSKITRDTVMGIPTKGKFLTKAGMFFNHPIPKGISFVLTAYEGYQEGKSIINFRDNLILNLYDLGVSINNEIFKDDPSKLRLFQSQPSNEKFRIDKTLRNQKIKELKEQASNQSGNNVIVVPENKQENQVNSTIPIKKGETEVSFVPFEPLNSVGTDILLHKLNQ